MLKREYIPRDDKAASRFAPKSDNGRFDLELVSVRGLLDSFESLGFDGTHHDSGGASIVAGQEPGEV